MSVLSGLNQSPRKSIIESVQWSYSALSKKPNEPVDTTTSKKAPLPLPSLQVETPKSDSVDLVDNRLTDSLLIPSLDFIIQNSKEL